MALKDVLPSFVKPYVRERSASDCLSALDFGEFQYSLPSDNHDYPYLKLVYNGQVLNIKSELIHASLSGISIKHYYGKCYQETTEQTDWKQDNKDPLYEYGEDDIDALDYFNDGKSSLTKTTGQKSTASEQSAAENDSSEYREDSVAEEGRPICTLAKINFRNSFWNIHRPELCKLTWGQNYVSAATVTEHLHEHLTPHGLLCQGFHTEADRISMLNRELDDYVRLKVLASPRELPPDEPLFNFNEETPQPKVNPKCKAISNMKVTVIKQNRYFPVKDDEEIRGRNLRRSQEEFCLTIGKYISVPLSIPSSSVLQEGYNTPELSSSATEEAGELFLHGWFLYGEEPLEDLSRHTLSSTFTDTNSESVDNSCPPLALDDFCRVVGKADFSDLRCNPDF